MVPDFNFYPGRNERGMMIKNVEYAPDYKPNYEYGKKNLGSCGIKFAKMSSRKPLNLGHASLNDDWLDPETFNKVHPFRVKSPKFEKLLPRESDPHSPLPPFMQKSVCSRISIGGVSQKTLESNGYMDSKFATVYSSFQFNAKSLPI